MIISFLIVCLRLFGLFWILGGIFTIKESFNIGFLNRAIAQITLEKEDKLQSIFVFICGVETLISGVGLFLAQKWVTIMLLILVSTQICFFSVRFFQYSQAQSAQEKEDFVLQPTTKNAFIVSVAVTIIAFLLLFE